MSRDTRPVIQAYRDEIKRLEDLNAQLVLALKVAAITNNNGDHWNPVSPFAFKIGELTGTAVPYKGVEPGEDFEALYDD